MYKKKRTTWGENISAQIMKSQWCINCCLWCCAFNSNGFESGCVRGLRTNIQLKLIRFFLLLNIRLSKSAINILDLCVIEKILFFVKSFSIEWEPIRKVEWAREIERCVCPIRNEILLSGNWFQRDWDSNRKNWLQLEMFALYCAPRKLLKNSLLAATQFV